MAYMKSKLELVTQTDGYFHELITQSLGANQLKTQPETEFYLVHLLNRFMTAEQLTREPLAFLWKDALEAVDVLKQASLFRNIGDVSLYLAGFFQESLNRKWVDVDYYVEMGGGAYAQAATLAEHAADGAPFKTVYQELSDKFPRFVDVLAEVSDRTTPGPRSEADLLRMYDLWVNTRSERAAKVLQEAGIVPNKTIKKGWQ